MSTLVDTPAPAFMGVVLPALFTMPFRAYSRHLHGTQVALVQLLAEESLGRGHAWAEMGLGSMARRMCQSRSTLDYHLRRLVRHHKVIEKRPGRSGTPNAYRIRPWTAWANWPHEQQTEVWRNLHLVTLGPDFNLRAVRAAEHLRMLCKRLHPDAPVPEFHPEDEVWKRWCRSMDRIVSEQRVGLHRLRDLFDMIERTPEIHPQYRGMNADMALYARLPGLLRALSILEH